ncbi:MAG TPA: two-component system sensor histidine kinase CreC [Permianibacter sp.]|nr:two-component system sensor histidine kinase CreC [Permianibacter sp.]
MKLGLRLFLGYFLIVGLTAWLSLKLVLDELKPVVRQVSEEALVELAQTLALVAQPAMRGGDIGNSELAQQLRQISEVQLHATIWREQKTRLNLRVYITDAQGVVRFDSSGQDVGKDYSRWNDVYLTLRGEYGVRSSRRDPANENSTTMFVAAPIRDGERLLGVLTVALPNDSTQPYIDAARTQLWRYGIALVGFSLLIGIGFTFWLISSLRKVSQYALAVSDNRAVQPPQFARGTELEKLTDAMETMRQRLEGKAYVEQYVLALTHELKSPLAAIIAATELLGDPAMPTDRRQQFLANIQQQSERLHDLIQRLLELAKLEQRRQLEQPENIVLADLVTAVGQRLSAALASKQLSVDNRIGSDVRVQGERFLLQQALQNLFDNAVAFAPGGSTLTVDCDDTDSQRVFRLCNAGPAIPAYALARLGERFYALPRPDGSKGSGLGLSFVREVMTLHGGSLQAENQAAGVCMKLRFPRPTI